MVMFEAYLRAQGSQRARRAKLTQGNARSGFSLFFASLASQRAGGRFLQITLFFPALFCLHGHFMLSTLDINRHRNVLCDSSL
jgi:hypothetical protein